MNQLLDPLDAGKPPCASSDDAKEPISKTTFRNWNWHDDADDIVLGEQPQTAVYINGSDAVTIRQTDNYGSDDAIVTVRPELAKRLCDAIMVCAAELLGGADAPR